MRLCRLAVQQAWGSLIQFCPREYHSLLFPNLLHPLLPLLPGNDCGSVVGVGLGEGCGHDGRALSADGCADGHEESVRPLV